MDKRLYRAERVNIRRDLDFTRPTSEVLEDPANVVTVDICTEPPYDVPPYTNASGDFLMTDRLTITGLRGFDEAIDFSKLHLDSRFCWNAMAGGADCELLGRIFHISHEHSYVNSGNKYASQSYDMKFGMPYLNGDDWGLGHCRWERKGERLWFVHEAAAGQHAPHASSLNDTEGRHVEAVRQRLVDVQPPSGRERPSGGACEIASIAARYAWITEIGRAGADRTIESTDGVFGTLAYLQIPKTELTRRPGERRWMAVEIEVLQGDIILQVQGDESIAGCKVSAGEGPVEIWLENRPGHESIELNRFSVYGPATRFRLHRATLFASVKDKPGGRVRRGLLGRLADRIQRLGLPA